MNGHSKASDINRTSVKRTSGNTSSPSKPKRGRRSTQETDSELLSEDSLELVAQVESGSPEDRDAGLGDVLPSMEIDKGRDQMPPLSFADGEAESVDYRSFAENILYCQIEIAYATVAKRKKEKQKLKNKGQDDEKSIENVILEQTCALLNSGGGVLVMENVDYKDAEMNALDRFWQKVEQKMKDMIQPSSYNNVFDLSGRSNDKVIKLFVNAPGHLCTLDFNLFFPGDTSVHKATYTQIIIGNLWQKQSSANGKTRKKRSTIVLKDHCKFPDVFKHEGVVDFHESKVIQFKRFTLDGSLQNHDQCEKVGKQMSAFANGDGGNIFLGISDESVIVGQSMKKNSEEDIERRIISIVDKMHWNVKPEKGTHWDVKFFPVSGTENSMLIVIYVAGMENSGGVFFKSPKSFELVFDDDGEGEVKERVQALKFKDWKTRMCNCSKINLQGDSKGLTTRFRRLKISKGPLLMVGESIQEIRDAFFKVEEGCPVSPQGFEKNLPEVAQAAVQQIQEKIVGRDRGLIVASRSWHSNVGGSLCDGVICDLLLVSRDWGGLHLFTLSETDDEKFINYCHMTARAIKKKLVVDGGCQEKFYVSCHVLPCNGNEQDVSSAKQNGQYPTEYDLNSSRAKQNELLKAMVIVLARVPSLLCNKLGVHFMNLLTVEQFRLVYMFTEIRELWVKGVAGSGKTLVAVKFMEKLKSRFDLENHEILCVCENKGIRQEIEHSNVCKVVCRKTFMCQTFPDVKHVVMDEVHGFRAEDGDWYQRARETVRQTNPAKPGYLWLFIDRSQTNHSYPTGIPPEAEQVPMFCLRKVIRNSKQIYTCAKKFLSEHDAKDTEIGHDFQGENVSFLKLETSLSYEVLKTCIQKLKVEGYEEGYLSILFASEARIPQHMISQLQHEFLKNQIGAAEDNRGEGLVVSTVRKYSGLERPVVILVNVAQSISPFAKIKRDAFSYCAYTRAMVKLVVIYQ